MTQKGTVTHIDGRLITVRCVNNCEKCETCKNRSTERSFQAWNGSNLEIAVGDLVTVHVPPHKAVTTGFMVFIMPLFFFFLLYALSARIGVVSEVLRASFGIGGIGFGFLVNFLIKLMKKQSDIPAITSIE